MLYDSSSGEEGIWKVQLKKIRASLKRTIGLKNEHDSGIKYLDQRTRDLSLSLIWLVVIAIIFTASSPYVTYGFLGLAIIGTVIWGVLRIRSILALKDLRQTQAQEYAEKSQSNVNKRMQSDAAKPRR